MALQDFLKIGLNRTKLASIIYGVRKSKGEGLAFYEKCFDSKTLTWKKPLEPYSLSYVDKILNDYFVCAAESIKVLNSSESIIDKSKVLVEMEPENSRSKVLQKSEPEISKLVVLKKPNNMVQISKGQRNSEPNTFKSKVVRKLVPKTSGSKFLKNSETNVKAYPRQSLYKKKVWNKPKHYYKARAHNKKKPRVTNTKGPVRLWVPKFETVFADMLKGKHITCVLMFGQWML